jgi:3-phosphoshikimate 1-carboxyvinyltransferase
LQRFGFGRNLQTNVDTHQGNKMTLVKQSDFKPENLNLDLNNTDIAQTSGDLLGLGIGCHLTGLHTLKSKKPIDWKQ